MGLATVRSASRLGLTAALVAVVALTLAASASAKGGHGGGKGGPPSWAGGGKSAKVKSSRGVAKKADKAAARKARKIEHAAKKAAKVRAGGEQNPAMTCFGRLAEMGEAFYEHYGTNPNGMNAFGKCVSEHAREKGAAGDEAESPADCEAPATEAGSKEPVEDECTPAEETPGECAEPIEEPTTELTAFDEETPADGECAPAEETPEDPEAGDASASLSCFETSAPRANPFALCV